ncbi:hypothetical protein [Bathymodiolus japonicus methanotrophic gill symbiont]|uniref:hypothetical protein n=1 Tax=Bathymodiolus japonicus methanotrophic gill symbiont TaxID=113269 RepID=UPI001C8E1EAE|nr:hypothetical protein [Bathymodiolus japonicus methanotrophic gill symbiont]
MCSVCGGRRAAGASPIRCVGERITATGVPEFREVAWRACWLLWQLACTTRRYPNRMAHLCAWSYHGNMALKALKPS